jgi:hypothetical protein
MNRSSSVLEMKDAVVFVEGGGGGLYFMDRCTYR